MCCWQMWKLQYVSISTLIGWMALMYWDGLSYAISNITLLFLSLCMKEGKHF